MAFLENRAARQPAIGPRHPDYQRWQAYFNPQGLADKAAAPMKKSGKRKSN